MPAVPERSGAPLDSEGSRAVPGGLQVSWLTDVVISWLVT